MSIFAADVYEDFIKVNKGVLYIMGVPGEGKTAIPEFIARRNGWDSNVIAAGLFDSSEMQGIPRTKLVKKIINGVEQEIEVSYFAPPEWLINAIDNANRGIKTLLIFDELNRGKPDVQNTILRMFNERMVGSWKVPEEVYFVATGNLGEEDGCNVEDFDTAMIGRLIPIRHNLTIEEWIQNFAKDNVNSYFVDWINATKITNNYKETNGAGDKNEFTTSIRPYLCYRSITTLSYHAGCVENKDLSSIIEKVQMKASYIIGVSAKKSLLEYLQSLKMINLDMIINNFDCISDELKKIKRDKQSELVAALMKQKISDFSGKQIDNVISFLKLIHKDELVSLFTQIIDEEIGFEKEFTSIKEDSKVKNNIVIQNPISKLFQAFPEEFRIVLRRNIEVVEENKKNK
jgi:hypothetical protein